MMKNIRFLTFVLLLGTLALSACGAAPATQTATPAASAKVEAMPVSFIGIVDSIAGDQWVISGTTMTVDASIVRDGPFTIGDRVKVEGLVNPDGSFIVSRVELPTPQETATLPPFGNDNANTNDANTNDGNVNDDNDNAVNSNDDNSNDSNSNDSNTNDDNSNSSNTNDDNGNVNTNDDNSNDGNTNDDNGGNANDDNSNAGNDNGDDHGGGNTNDDNGGNDNGDNHGGSSNDDNGNDDKGGNSNDG